MPAHPARFPGTINDPAAHILTERQARRLSALAHIPAAELAGKKLAEVEPRLRTVIDPGLFFFPRVCGQVVKTDAAAGQDLPVPFATVTAYDVDFRFLAYSPPGSMYSWFCPFFIRREKLATVTTDECGRFCVRVPRFDIDFYMRWRKVRRCYLTWLRKPTIDDLLRAHEIIPRPQPDPGPIHLDEHALARAARVLDPAALARLREVSVPPRVGGAALESSAALTRAAFPVPTRPPLSGKAIELLSPAMRPNLAARAGVSVAAIEKLDSTRWIGPFIRCREVMVPEWKLVLDVPDLSFEVTQDVDGDGAQEVIYREGLFDVRWGMELEDLTLHADASAITGVGCDVPALDTGATAILSASNYPLQVGHIPSDFHDGASGYAKLPNRPDQDGIPGGTRKEFGKAPFTDPFYLVGYAERSDATHYRVHHQIDGGSTTFLNGSYGPLLKLVGGTLLQNVVSPMGGQWYPIIPRSDKWTPVGILAPVAEGGDRLHTFKLELGKPGTGGGIEPIANSQTDPVNLRIDSTPPNIEFLALEWRHPDTSLAWKPLPLFSDKECPVIQRSGTARVQLHLSLRISADHLRSFTVTPVGCGHVSPPELITDMRNGLPAISIGAADSGIYSYWHMDPDTDNVQTRDFYYELPAGAPAGCYHFSVYAVTRAFRPTMVPLVDVDDAKDKWRVDPEPVWRNPWLSFSVQ